MLTALSSTLPDLKMQFTQRSVSVLGDHMLAALLSCDSTPDSVLEAEVNQDELATRRPTSAPSLKAEVQRDGLETCRPTSAPSLEADGTPAPQPDPTGTICSASHVAAPMELLVGGQTAKQPTFQVGGQTRTQPTIADIDGAEAASQVQLTDTGSMGFSCTSDGELWPAQVVTAGGENRHYSSCGGGK